ncbi:MAG: hypothetical protein HQM12_04255 [SAR324 cluster bacterium]|nr:hypothetical protein [SAR324 cluster bacterium]
MLIIIEALENPQQITSSWRFPVLMSGLLWCFWSVMPLAYHVEYYHLEGTSRNSSMSLFAVLFSMLITQISPLERKSMGNKISDSACMILTGAFLFLLNPANLFVCAGLTGMILVMSLIRTGNMVPLITAVSMSVLVAIIFMDPYYQDRLLRNQLSNDYFEAGDPVIFPGLSILLETGLNQFRNLENYRNIFSSHLWNQDMSWMVSLSLFAGSMLLLIKKQDRWRLRVIMVSGLLFVGYFMPLQSVLRQLQHIRDYSLLADYVPYSQKQILWFWLMIMLWELMRVVWDYSLRPVRVLGILILVGSFSAMTQPGLRVNQELRKNYCGSMGCLRNEDERVIKYMVTMKKEFTVNFPEMPQPLILVENAMAQSREHEKWLFPLGGARVLPLYDTFPLAFYYFQGNRELYTFENYKNNICEQWNDAWLKEHNIKYLFIGTDRQGGCIHELDKLVQEKTVLIRRNHSLLLQLN